MSGEETMLKTDKNLYIPSFQFEKRTKAFNKYIWIFVAMISMFTIDVIVLGAFHTFLCYFLQLVSTFIKDNMLIVFFVPVIVCIALSYQMVQWGLALMTSYEYENGKIIKGRIQKTEKIEEAELIKDAEILGGMIKNLDNPSKVMTLNTLSNISTVARLIQWNLNQEFVEKFFHTDLYKKEIYENPQLIKLTKYSWVYACDNHKRLVIPKIYEGICDTENKKESSFIGRILVRSGIVLVMAMMLACVDLATGYYANNQYVKNIESTRNVIEQELNHFGYTSKTINEKMYRFTKEVRNGDRTSEISYHFDKNGNIVDVDIQLYYDTTAKNLDEELTYIISTINHEFDSEEVRDFVDLVKLNLDGEYQYGKLESEGFKLIIGKSEGYVDIH